MSTGPPFIDRESGALDTSQILSEAYPLAGLIMLFGGLALVPFALLLLFGRASTFGFVLGLLVQFVLVLGTGIVLIYIIARGVQLGGR